MSGHLGSAHKRTQPSPTSIPAAGGGRHGAQPAVLHDGGGLYLRVSAACAKSWVLRFQLDGKRRDLGSVPFPIFAPAEAGEHATVHHARRPAAAKGRTSREV